MAQIKKDTTLRKAILQAAITGQLISTVVEPVETTEGESLPLAAAGKPSSATPSAGTPRNAPTETGKQLLDRIIEERNKKLLAEWEEALKKNPKVKKPAPVVASEIDEEEIPFEIPENWCWCRLGDLISISSGDMLTSSQMKNGKIPVYGGNGITGYHNVSNIHEETIVIGRVGFYCGNVHLTEKEAWVTDNAFTTSYSKKCLNREYLIIALRQLDLGRQQNKTAQPVVSGKKIYPMLFPLPPLAVQNAIVETLEQVLPLVDAYENALLQKEELKNALPDKVKKAILQEAITGKLTEQWRKQKAVVEPVETTESGKQLLDRIIKERNAKALAEWEEALKKNPKAKKPAPIVASEIDEEEIPFEVSESWCWCKLGDICTKLVDGDHNPPAGVPTKTEFIMASSQNINDDSLVELEKVRYLSKEVFEVENERTKAEKGDIFFTSVGTLGRSCIFDGSRNICFQRSVSVIKTEIYNKFLKYCLDAPFIQYFIIDNATGTAQKGFYLNQLAKLVIPLPPLEEQEEIVKKLEELLPLCK